MVFLSKCFYSQSRRVYSSDFIDKVRIYVCGGTGGNGFQSMGGVGGQGGHVYVVGSKSSEYNLSNFKDFYPTKRFIADPGSHSRRRSLSGLNGASIFVQVPCGVSVIDCGTNKVIGEISKPSDKLLVAKGGLGGTYRTNFLPKKGKRRSLFLNLKLIGDVGFVGFPNAGKSTLLSKLSRATPAVSNLPFTTIKPELGIIKYPDFRRIQLADLPGLIEGAYMNKGRGHSFLKHIERTRLLLFVVDVTGFQLSPESPFRDAFETVQLLTKELELYDSSLVDRQAILAVNKMDKENSSALLNELNEKLANFEDHLGTLPEKMIPEKQMDFKGVIPISAIDSMGISDLKSLIRERVDKLPAIDSEQLMIDFEKQGLVTDDSKQTIPVLM